MPDQGPAIVRLCRQLEGLPLSTELAAHRIAHYSLDEMARPVAEGLDLLETTGPGRPVRQRSIRAVFDPAWRLVPAQRALARLAVFRPAARSANGPARRQEGPRIG